MRPALPFPRIVRRVTHLKSVLSRMLAVHTSNKGETVMSQVAPKKRPIGVTILAILAGIAAVLAGVHTLQSLGIFPYVIGPVKLHSFNLWNALMWGLMVWVYVWLAQMLWRVDPQAWLF